MLIVDMPMPSDCVYCSLRMDCITFRVWLKTSGMRLPKRIKNLEGCLIKGEIPDGQVDLIDKYEQIKNAPAVVFPADKGDEKV